MTERLAGWCARRRRLVFLGWTLAVLLAAGANAALLGDALSGDEEVTAETESTRADALIRERSGPGGPTEGVTEAVVVRSGELSAQDEEFAQAVRALEADLRAAGADAVTSYYSTEDPRFVSADEDAVGLLLALGRDAEDEVEDVVAAVEALDGDPRFEAAVTGDYTLDADFNTLSEEDLVNGELGFGLPAALIVLLLVFGSLVAGFLPIVLALVSISVGLGLLAFVGSAFPLSVFAVNMLTGMGLALGIDYALFTVARYREERARGAGDAASIVATGATASRAVLFSGVVFVLAMLGLLLVPSTIMRSLAAGAIVVAIASIAVALTLLPALLAALGDRIDALRLPLVGRRWGASEGSIGWRTAQAVLRRPLAYALAAAGALVVLALPVFDMNPGEAGVSTLPDDLEAKQGAVLLTEEFPGESTDPIEVVIVGDDANPGISGGVAELRDRLAESDLVGRVDVEGEDGAGFTVLTASIGADALGQDAIDLVRELREDWVPDAFAGSGAEVLVTGDTAETIDESDTMSDWLPIVVLFVLALSLLLITAAFRSLVVAVKAVIVNLLAVTAAYGVLVAVFQKGWGNELFGFEQVDTIEAWVPLFLFAVLFGLSMDYHVFLLSRIRERYAETGDNAAAIVHGVSSTARVITGAALIIIAVFSGFARGDMVMFQQMGFGVAVALLLDATLVRLVLIPATMQLLGDRNWYLPSWLAWLPSVAFEGDRRRGGQA